MHVSMERYKSISELPSNFNLIWSYASCQVFVRLKTDLSGCPFRVIIR